MTREFNENVPIYLQIIRWFELAVARGQIAGGERLPAVRETAVNMKVNPNTVQRAYQEMERSGLVVTKRGQGSFVTDNPEFLANLRDRLAQESVSRFVAEMTALGYTANDLAAVLVKYTK